MYYQRVSDLLKYKRTLKGISQEVLAAHIPGVSGQLISNIERGLYTMPLKYVRAVCILLEIEQKDFIEALSLDYKQRLCIKLGEFHDH